MGHQLKLMGRARISRCIKRMAIQVYEHFSVNLPLHIIGLNERGFALAKELVSELNELRPNQDNFIYQLDVFSKGNKTIPDLNDQQVLIVNDVVFWQHYFKRFPCCFTHKNLRLSKLYH